MLADVVSSYEHLLSDTIKLCSSFYNKTTKKRRYYLCPIKQGVAPLHVWGDLVEKAGYKLADAPNT
jgi:multiple sugar transport system substrate-binding protein